MILNKYLKGIRKTPIKYLPKKALGILKKKLISKFKTINDCVPENLHENLAIKNNLFSINTNLLENKEKIINKADKVCNHIFNILGSEDVNLGKKINWHKDFKSETEWDLKYYTNLDYENLDDNSDAKVPWEINRFHHLVTVGIAYSITRNERYSKEFKDEIKDWMKINPFCYGINWVNSMEVAIRAINWIYTYYFLKGAVIEKAFWNEFINMLFLHGRFIRKNLESTIPKENHYLSGIVGLFHLGIFFNQTKEGKRWLKFSKEELEKEIINQVYKDGVNHEASINYHRLVTELFLLSYIYGNKNGIQFSDQYKSRLEKMIEFIMYYTKPNGKAPIMGDMDNGRISDFWLEDFNDHRDIIALGAILFKRKDFKKYGLFGQRLTWLVGNDGYKTFENLNSLESELKSKTFEKGGFYIMRNEQIYLIIRCGDIGRKGFGGHGHNDALSFELNIDGKDIIIDPGSYVYTSNIKLRHLFRSTKYHNALVIDNEEINKIDIKDPFNMEEYANAECILWQTDSKKEIFAGQHYGFGTTYRRKIEWDKIKRTILITDKIFDRNKHDLKLNYHLSKNIELKKILNSFKVNDCVVDCENLALKRAYISPSYGIKHEAYALSRIENQSDIKEILTKISY